MSVGSYFLNMNKIANQDKLPSAEGNTSENNSCLTLEPVSVKKRTATIGTIHKNSIFYKPNRDIDVEYSSGRSVEMEKEEGSESAENGSQGEKASLPNTVPNLQIRQAIDPRSTTSRNKTREGSEDLRNSSRSPLRHNTNLDALGVTPKHSFSSYQSKTALGRHISLLTDKISGRLSPKNFDCDRFPRSMSPTDKSSPSKSQMQFEYEARGKTKPKEVAQAELVPNCLFSPPLYLINSGSKEIEKSCLNPTESNVKADKVYYMADHTISATIPISNRKSTAKNSLFARRNIKSLRIDTKKESTKYS